MPDISKTDLLEFVLSKPTPNAGSPSRPPARAYGGRGIRGGGFSVYDPPPHSIQ